MLMFVYAGDVRSVYQVGAKGGVGAGNAPKITKAVHGLVLFVAAVGGVGSGAENATEQGGDLFPERERGSRAKQEIVTKNGRNDVFEGHAIL